MGENLDARPRHRRAAFLLSGLLAATLLLLTIFQTILAQEREDRPPELGGSEKIVSNDSATPGTSLAYSVVISNSGDVPASDVFMTDTLDANLAYEMYSLSVIGGGNYGVSGNVITWTGSVNNGSQIVVNFSATITDSVVSGTTIANTAFIAYSGSVISRTAITAVITDTDSTTFLPIMHTAPPVVTLNPIGQPGATNSWTLTWATTDATLVTGYEIQESNLPSFPSPTVINVGVVSSHPRTLPLSTQNIYYYRIRAMGPWGATPWSNIQFVVGGYRDDFPGPATNWAIRRQDTDDIENYVFLRNDHVVLNIAGRWDYIVAGPMAPVPLPPYMIQGRVRLTGVDNLHSYGFIWGGDWNGSVCPNPDYSSCFNHYYRLNIIWYGAPDRLRIQLKRIDYHDPDDNAGRGVELIGFSDVQVNVPPSGYQVWAIKVNPNGLIQIFVNGNLVGQKVDSTYINDRYFGAFASTNEYSGLDAEYDWYQVNSLP